MTKAKIKKSKYVFRIEINASPEEIWKKITTTDEVQSFFFNTILTTTDNFLREDSPIVYYDASRTRKIVEGVVRQLDPPRIFSHTFRFLDREEPESLVSWELNRTDKGTEVVVIHEQLENNPKTREDISDKRGWPFIIENLKKEVE